MVEVLRMFSFFFDRMGLAFYKFSVHSNKIYAVIVSASRYFLLVIFHVQTRRGRNVLSVQPHKHLYLLHRCKDDMFLITQVIWEHHSWIWDIVSRRLTIFLHLKSVNRENNCHLSATHLFRGCLFPSSGWNLNQQLFNVTRSDVVSTDAPASLLVDEQKLLDGTLKSPAAKYCSNI